MFLGAGSVVGALLLCSQCWCLALGRRRRTMDWDGGNSWGADPGTRHLDKQDVHMRSWRTRMTVNRCKPGPVDISRTMGLWGCGEAGHGTQGPALSITRQWTHRWQTHQLKQESSEMKIKMFNKWKTRAKPSDAKAIITHHLPPADLCPASLWATSALEAKDSAPLFYSNPLLSMIFYGMEHPFGQLGSAVTATSLAKFFSLPTAG